MRRIIIILAIISIPLAAAIPTQDNLWYGQYLALLVFLGLYGSLAIWKFNKYISLFMLLCLSSVIYPGRMGTRAIFLLATLYGAIYGIYGVSKLGKRSGISLAIASLTLFMGGYLLIQYFNLDPFFDLIGDTSKDGMYSFLGANNQVGSFFAITMPFAIKHFRLKGFPIILPFSLLGLYISKSSFAIMAVCIGMSFYYFFKNRKLFKKIFVGLLILGFIYVFKIDRVKEADFSTRFNVWKYAIASTIKGRMEVNIFGANRIAVARPCLGFGFSNWSAFFTRVPQRDRGFNYVNEKFRHAHNDFVEGFFEMGIPFAAIGLLFYLNLFRRFLRAKKTDELLMFSSAFVIFSVNATGNFICHLAYSGLLLIVILGLLFGELKEREFVRYG